MKTINQQWKDFEVRCLPKNTSPIQRREMKRAFFVGFAAAFNTMAEDIAELPEDEGVKEMKSLNQQLLGFNEALKLGAA